MKLSVPTLAWRFTGLTVLVLAFTGLQSRAGAQYFSLGTAQSFGVLGGSMVANTGTSVIDGDVGVSLTSTISGFPPGVVTPPATIHAEDAVALQAQNDDTTAYKALAGLAPTQNLTGQDLGGLTLTPGVYFFSSTAQLTGTLTLDAQGNADALFVFQIGSTLITASNASVVEINNGNVGGGGCNVFWQVGSSATLGTDTVFEGNILAYASITLNTGATIEEGRTLAQTGAVTLDDNVISSASCPTITGAAGTFGTVVPGTGTTVPEPGAVALLGSLGMTGAAFLRRRRAR